MDSNKRAIKAAFSKAAVTYDQFAELQRDIGRVLTTLFTDVLSKNAPSTAHLSLLDLGCGTGYFTEKLAQHYSDGAFTCFDLSPAMLQQAALRKLENTIFIEGDIDVLPFATAQFDGIFSNLALQWSDDITHSLKQVNKTLKPQGVLGFSTLLTGSLLELKQAWTHVDDNPHVNQFLDEQSIRQSLESAGFHSVQLTTETRVKHYMDVKSVMRSLKGIGANYVYEGESVGLKGKQLLNTLTEGYMPYRDHSGLYPLTYEVCYVIATKQEQQ